LKQAIFGTIGINPSPVIFQCRQGLPVTLCLTKTVSDQPFIIIIIIIIIIIKCADYYQIHGLMEYNIYFYFIHTLLMISLTILDYVLLI
jgi:hypothetical protein